jgi:alpha-L-fucosidase 2
MFRRVPTLLLVLACAIPWAPAQTDPAYSGNGEIRLAPDWQEFLAKNDLVWTTMPTSWNDGPFTGNGLLGTIFWQTSTGMYFEVSRPDVYDHRNTDYVILIGRCRLPNGNFTLRYAGQPVSGGNMRLDLWNAEARGTMTTTAGSINMRTFTHAIDNVMVIELTATGGETASVWQWNPQISETTRGSRDPRPADYRAYPPQVQEVIDGISVSTQSMPESTLYNTQGRGVGEYATAWKVVTQGSKRTIFISEAFSYPGTTAKQQAIAAVAKAVQDGVAVLEASHRAWWHEYYPKSFLTVPHANAERFYWVQMYKMASATRGDRALIDLMGPWYDRTNWPGIWWNLNIQLSYWPFYVSNHIEESNSLLAHLDRNKASLARNAAPYQSDSYAIFRATSPDLTTEWFPTEAGNLAFALNNLWQQYRYTMDDDMLREKLFPLMKGAFNYLLHLSHKTADGKIHINNTLSPEYPGSDNANDTNYTLALFKFLAKALLYANERLELNDAIAVQAQDVMDNLTPYPADATTGFRIAANLAYTQSHRHWSHLFMIYPLFEYTYDDPAQAAMADKSINHWNSLSGSFRGYSRVVNMSFAAMKGNGTTALTYLNSFLNTDPSKNTMYRETDPVIETPLFFARAMQDMALMSYNGMIRVFPGIPSTWADVAFDDFRAEGAFLVSAKRQGGSARFVRVESLAGEPCKVKAGIAGTLKYYGSRPFAISTVDGITEIDLEKGEYVILYASDTLAGAPSITSTPPTSAETEAVFTYDVESEGNPAPAYSFDVAPQGMTIDPQSGLISWMPQAAGSYDVTVRAGNGSGIDALQSFSLTVTWGTNMPPTITSIADRFISVNRSTRAIEFTIGDRESPAGSLQLSGSSSNTILVPSEGIVFGGSGDDRRVTITPAPNQIGTTEITVTVSDGELAASTAFDVTVTATATEAWRLEHFGTTSDTGAAADLADPDHDGIPNLLELALDGDPNVADVSVLPRASREGEDLVLVYKRMVAVPGEVQFVVEAALSPEGVWSASGVIEEVIADDGTVQTVKARTAVGDNPQKYLRLRVTRI